MSALPLCPHLSYHYVICNNKKGSGLYDVDIIVITGFYSLLEIVLFSFPFDGETPGTSGFPPVGASTVVAFAAMRFKTNSKRHCSDRLRQNNEVRLLFN